MKTKVLTTYLDSIYCLQKTPILNFRLLMSHTLVDSSYVVKFVYRPEWRENRHFRYNEYFFAKISNFEDPQF